MRAGKLHSYVELQQKTVTHNGIGEATETWTKVDDIWAHIMPIYGYERFQQQAPISEVSHRITIRYRSGVTNANRIVYGGRTFEIEAVMTKDERNREMILLCSERS